MKNKRITVFTPTYNRAYILEKLYRSLQRQTFTDFEWLVVDDGSTDNTEELFETWVHAKNAFSVRYYKTVNGGKHRAINRGLDLAEGEIFFTVDSDDELTKDALIKVNRWFQDIDGAKNIVGIAANRGFSASETVNALFSEPYLDKTLMEMKTYREDGRLVLDGERAIAFYTDYHRKYKFPEFDGENFMTEGVVYNRMSRDGARVRFYNDIIWIFEYLEDGLTKTGTQLFLKNPKGYGLYITENLETYGAGAAKRMTAYYQFTCDLTAYGYSPAFAAECLGKSTILIRLMDRLHKVRLKMRRNEVKDESHS